MKIFLPLLASLIIVSLATPAEATEVLNKEGVIGATTGGIAGGVIGHQSGHRTGGAIIGSVAGYAIGTTIHRQKQRQKQLEQERREVRQLITERAQVAQTPPPAPPRSVQPELTASEKQQLLLQATPLFSVRRTE